MGLTPIMRINLQQGRAYTQLGMEYSVGLPQAQARICSTLPSGLYSVRSSASIEAGGTRCMFSKSHRHLIPKTLHPRCN
ncbi:hypothetical protein LIA77_00661 [Sarocladium implicatum]|nr:hypothetical protein LIA77_00661 [Sarocladium implicatum]